MKPVVSAAFLAALSVTPLTAAVELTGIAAKVNGHVITKREVYFHLAPTVNMLRAKYPRLGEQYRREFQRAQEEVLERLIENRLVLSNLEDKGLKVPDHVIDQEVNRIIREVFNGNEDEFRKHLDQTGMTRRAFRESQREAILVQAFKSQQFRDVAPSTPDEIRKRYKERKHELRDRSKDLITFRKIFIPSADRDNLAATPEDQLALAEEIAGKLRDGADFPEMARKHSAGAFAENGGLWEDTPRTDLETGFADIIFDAEKGTIVGPLKDPRGFTIVEVLGIKTGPAPPLDKEMRERMRREVEIEKRSDRYQKWLELLKRNAMVERRI